MMCVLKYHRIKKGWPINIIKNILISFTALFTFVWSLSAKSVISLNLTYCCQAYVIRSGHLLRGPSCGFSVWRGHECRAASLKGLKVVGVRPRQSKDAA